MLDDASRLGREHDQIAAVVRDRLVARRVVEPSQVDSILNEVRGNFSPALQRALRLVVDPAFGDRLTATGPLEELRELSRRATLVFTPTHSSSFDTIVMALTLARAGLPPAVMPGDRHMHRNRLLSFLIRNLGGWKID